MAEPVPNTLPPMPKVTIGVFIAAATCFVYGLGLAVGGHEWQRPGSFQPGVGLVVFAVVTAVVTGSLHMAYCYGWDRRGAQASQAPEGQQGAVVAPGAAAVPVAA